MTRRKARSAVWTLFDPGGANSARRCRGRVASSLSSNGKGRLVGLAAGPSKAACPIPARWDSRKSAAMLIIRAKQLAALDRRSEQQFRHRLLESIRQDHPTYSALSPVVLDCLVGMGLRRARSLGLSWQSSLTQFVHLMAGVAPDFDLHPAIHAGLVNSAVPHDERIEALAESLPDGVWDEAAQEASTLGWFLTEDGFDASPAQRIARALRRALPQAVVAQAVDLDQRAARAMDRAVQAGFIGADGQFVYAACDLLYGHGFETALDWARALWSDTDDSDLRAALLRARIAIDTGAWL